MAIANELMIKAITEITLNEGLNPRESVIVAGGGAAGFNIMPIAAELGCTTVIVPRTASVLSACGMQYSDIVFEATRSRFTDSASFDAAAVNAALDAIEAELEEFRQGLVGLRDAPARTEMFVEARYRAQVWELDTRLPSARLTDAGALAEAFHQVHERLYAVRDEGSAVEFVNWKGRIAVRAFTAPKVPDLAAEPYVPVPDAHRDCYFAQTGRVRTPIYRGEAIRPGARIEGPAIIEEPTTTIVVYANGYAECSPRGHFLLHVTEG
jgi:N-methylhydantoinase A